MKVSKESSEESGGFLETIQNTFKGMFDGLVNVLKDTFMGLAETVEQIFVHPVEFTKGMYDAVSHPQRTLTYMWESLEHSWTTKVIHGDARSRAEFFTYSLVSIVGLKGLNKVGKLGKLSKTMRRDGKSSIPYNAMKTDSLKTDIETRLRNTLSNSKDQALQFARSKPVRDAIQMKALSNHARDLYTRAGNVFNPDRIKNVMQSTYDKVIQGPVSRVSRFTSRTVNSMVDSTMPQTQMAGVRGGMDWRSVDEDTYRFAKRQSNGESTRVLNEDVYFGKYSTSIDNKVKVIEKVELPDWISDSFKDSNYRTVVTEENITFYRTYGGAARANGSFVTTSSAGNRINAKIDTALVPDWKNTRENEAIIEVPKGQILNIGRVEKQYTKTGAPLEGDADQVLLPQGWPPEWIKDIREVPSK
ncbi:hypothetical protein LCM20_16605 [Halobacillus litoralis]|uniref:hypothetical protein n=1 Tax=Halobacillus litoralis TaxID=45668 RepID=UPI001CD4CD09|nr:hypothetical protein [Halobacillus litoralis]MCA0972231.1 hypothetical protein [Halobacillus litoralis]